MIGEFRLAPPARGRKQGGSEGATDKLTFMEPAWPMPAMPLDVCALAEAVWRGSQPDYLVFPDWGGAPPVGWLAPWTPTPFETATGAFASGEHYLMHAKALLFGDHSVAEKILRAKSPGQARELGRRVSGFDENVWTTERGRVMDETNQAKFSALPELAAYLLSTWPAVLVQASALDCVWGSGLDLGDSLLRRPERWPGQNLVGFSLMRVREGLRRQGNYSTPR
jgi:ribA/ribD-fused uncharacterized protein